MKRSKNRVIDLDEGLDFSGPNVMKRIKFKSVDYAQRRPLALNEADVFNAVLVDPVADIIKHAADLGYSLGEIKHGLDVAGMHAEAELTGKEP